MKDQQVGHWRGIGVWREDTWAEEVRPSLGPGGPGGEPNAGTDLKGPTPPTAMPTHPHSTLGL